MKKTKGVFALMGILILFMFACSFTSSDSQGQPNNGENPSGAVEEVPQEEQQQQPVIEPTSTAVGGGEISPISFEIYEYKEGFTEGDHLVQEGAGWKSYHAKFRIVANQPVSGQYIINLINMKIGAINIDIDPYVVTKEGYNYGDTLDTAFTINFDIPIIGQLDLFHGIPVGSSRSYISGNVREYVVNFSVPEKLTPEKIVIPTLDDSVILPPLGTEDTSEISLQTNQIVDFPATVPVDPKINVKVSNFQQDENYIRIDYEIINTDIASNQAGFYYAALVDSHGFASRQIVDVWQPLSECPGEFVVYDNIVVGPGQTKTGKLCFSKNTGYQSSFYVLYFSDTGTAGPDNKAILIKP